MTDHQPLHLFDLPIEILSQILHPLLRTSNSRPIPLTLCSRTAKPRENPFSSPSSILPILLAHPRLHAVATPLLYGPEHEFLLDLAGKQHAVLRRLFEERQRQQEEPPRRWRDPPPPPPYLLWNGEALRRIVRLSLRLDRLRGWMGDVVVPLITDMIMHGELRQLDVFLATDPDTPSHLSYREDKVISVPMKGLMILLADPYLRSARMCVQARHGEEWCRFHSEGCAATTSHEGGGLVEIDWRMMMREADPEGEHFPITALGERDDRW